MDEIEKEHTHADVEYGYIAPDSNAEGVFKTLSRVIQRGLKPGLSVSKGADGKRRMMIVTSNSYEDRENETITTDALKAWVDTCWSAVEGEFATDNPLVFWHDMRVKMGDIVWSDVRGPFLVEMAVEADSPLAHKMFDYVEAHPDEKWGASHKFAYHKSNKDDDGTYHRIFKKETTVLPRSAAANALTFSGVIPMADKRGQYLNKMLGIPNADELLDKGMDFLLTELNKQGVEHKSEDKPQTPIESIEGGAAEVKKSFGVLVASLIEAQSDLDARTEANADELKALKDEKVTAEKAKTEKEVETANTIKSLQEQITALKTQLDTRPKSASNAPETEISKDKLPEEVTAAMVTRDSFWHAEVKQG